ncbi:HIRAN domain-containing protein [Glacieibacterium megasporae]|uniref:HIRAN domain-containing protein n=1 Tax=Glacieibacterium megasporae TaxID=2835787 RepID=UPI001C1E8241|nr:HIRAN domain-containing protein [Polymorphobacter megasporae]UAJ10080.1 HIRAN domain-containing protein [Polymorphobacter megasporae]
MARPDMSLTVVGGLHPNKDGSNRLFEMALCLPGEPVQLVREPRNPIDPSAVAVLSARGIQLGYLSAERCGWIGARLAQGDDIRAVFQFASSGVAVIRVSFGGDLPELPASSPTPAKPATDDSGFYPDDIPDDDYYA